MAKSANRVKTSVSRRAPPANGRSAAVIESGTGGRAKSPVFVGLIPCVVIAAVIALVVAARIRLLDTPLERDEGEYAYIGQLMLQGVAPYGSAANMKLPGTYAAYALVMGLFGQTIAGIHLGLLLVNLGSAVLVYFLTRRLFDPHLPSRSISTAGLAAAGAYVVLSVATGVMGLWAHATHFVILPALGATLLLMRWSTSRNIGILFASGLLYGLAFVMKQPGFVFALFGVFYLVWSCRAAEKRLGAILLNLALFGFAATVPFGVTCLLLWRAGVFDKFWFWVVDYGRHYASILTISLGFQAFMLRIPKVLSDVWPIWLLALAGLVVLWRGSGRRQSAMLATVFFAVSFGAVCPGLYFREHYFVLLLPAIALLASALVVSGSIHRSIPLWIVAGTLVFALVNQRQVLFELSPDQVSRTVYTSSPFVEAIEVANYIREHSSKDAKLAILGSEPEILFYSARRSVTPFIYVYSLMEPQPFAARMQEEFIRDVEQSRPEYLVLVNNEGSWVVLQGSSTRILDWSLPYGNRYYEQVGLVDMVPDGTTYAWGADAAHATPKSHFYLAVWKRKAGPGQST